MHMFNFWPDKKFGNDKKSPQLSSWVAANFSQSLVNLEDYINSEKK